MEGTILALSLETEHSITGIISSQKVALITSSCLISVFSIFGGLTSSLFFKEHPLKIINKIGLKNKLFF